MVKRQAQYTCRVMHKIIMYNTNLNGKVPTKSVRIIKEKCID